MIPSETKLIFQQDWLGSKSYFYNLKTGKHGFKIWDAIDNDAFSFEDMGLSNYFKFGYSVFGSTPIENVKFLAANERLWVDKSGKLKTDQICDPIENWSDGSTSVDDVIDRLRTNVSSWAQRQNGRIVLPLSGGLDSRLLLWALPNKQVVDSYTYGISKKQINSTEVIYASEIAKRLSVNWKHIDLTGFHGYINHWEDLYGLSVHAHGMYHLKFYNEVERIQKKQDLSLLSGIFGDAWAGSIPFMRINSPQECARLGYTHGITADPNALQRNTSLSNDSIENFYHKNKDKLSNPRYQTVAIVRLKMKLISFLMSAPMEFGFTPWSPFLDSEIVRTMLFLPKNLRMNRNWQRDFLMREGLGIEHKPNSREAFNSLDFDESVKNPLPCLDLNLLHEWIKPEYVKWINKTIQISRLQNFFYGPRTNIITKKLSFPKKWSDWFQAYSAYMILYPVQSVVKRFT